MRVVKAKHAGACYGVQRALDMALEAAGRTEGASTLGPLIHNPQVVGELAERAARASAQGDEAAAAELAAFQRAFVNDHLGAWVPAFCDDVEGGARTSFYRGLAALTRQQVEADREVLAAL